MTDGYPDEEDIEYLKAGLSTGDFHDGALVLSELIESTGFGKATFTSDTSGFEKLSIATGGWSGCEEILSETHMTLWRALYWQSSHRGGLEVFGK
jgi:hypothetical protein